jgi:hypothetical protein
VAAGGRRAPACRWATRSKATSRCAHTQAQPLPASCIRCRAAPTLMY